MSNGNDEIISRAKTMPKEEGKPFILSNAHQLRQKGRHSEAVSLMREYANLLIDKGDFGWATDLIKEAADWCIARGENNYAALMLSDLATLFLDSKRHLYGWAASNYYAAAMCFAEEGNVSGVRDVLKAAYDGYFAKANDFHTPWFREHLAILESDKLRDIDKLDALASDFRLKNRDSWVRSCRKGIQVLLSAS